MLTCVGFATSVLPRAAGAADRAEPATPTAPDASAAPLSPSERGTRVEQYPFEILAVDILGLATGLVLADQLEFPAGRQPPVFGLATATWYGIGAVGAPAVHYAHGNRKAGVASFAMRSLLPPAVGFAGFSTVCLVQGRVTHDCVVQGYSGGAFLGVALTAGVDAFSLAQPTGYEEKPHERWYGAPMLAIDAAGVALGAYGFANRDADAKNSLAANMFAGAYVFGILGGPIVHFVNGQLKKGFLSLGMRLVAPLLIGPPVGILGYCAAVAATRGCVDSGAQWGAFGGTLAVAVFDSLSVAREEVQTDTAAYRPYVYATPGFVGVGGTW